jgi:hypothetical protein
LGRHRELHFGSFGEELAMGLRSLIGVMIVGLAFVFVGCDSDKAQKIQPETRGKRNELCQARNDCEEGLACLGGVCSKNEFGLDVSAKQCDRIECAEDTDCCGDRPMSAPAKCKDRATLCSPQLPGCVNDGNICTSDASCTGGGTCPMGTCSTLGTSCESTLDCKDSCDPLNMFCKGSFASCTVETEATTCPNTYSCSTRFCSCANPDYEPGNPICTDEDCDPSAVCTLRCDEERCVQDTSCEEDIDCNAAAPMCDDGRCVECLKESDCNEDDNEECISGFCHKPCEVNEECGLFSECQGDGTCKYVGCKADKDCILAANRGIGDGIGGTTNTGISSGSDDARLFKCLPSETEEDVGVCKIPCENDGSCGQFQVCSSGYCKFIGCENDEQCRAYLGIANEMTSDEKPFVAKAVCRE